MDIKKAEILFSDPQFVKLAKDKVNDANALKDLFKEKEQSQELKKMKAVKKKNKKIINNQINLNF